MKLSSSTNPYTYTFENSFTEAEGQFDCVWF